MGGQVALLVYYTDYFIGFDDLIYWNILCELPCNSHKMFQ